jgi:2-oxoglutarate dehydrogenase E2 component (dihydrolipoamide succinyltransferase)
LSTVDIRMPDEEKEGTEASLATWLKQVGDTVSEHEPLVEISTDKVTIEIPSPANGVLIEISKVAGDNVLPGDLLGRIGSGPGAVASPSGADSGYSASTSGSAREAPPATTLADDSYSPAVRRLLKEHHLDPLQIPKVSRGGRLTIEDVSAFLASKDQTSSQKERKESKADVDDPFVGRKIPHTPMRKSIANHMARSVQTAPHVTSVFEADLSAVLSDRATRKADQGAEAVPSVTAYLIQAALKAIRVVSEVNSKWHDDYLEVFDWVNFGVGTALESGGLVVPVIRGAQAMDLLTLSQRLRDLTQKARSGKLTQDDMSGGTFTLSNHGVSGSLLAAPIILPHGQAAILGAGKMQRRVIVCETGGRELFRIRPMMYVTLTIDHRVLDGQQTNLFLTKFVAALEASNDADAEA